MTPRQRRQYQALEATTWVFHLAVEHLATERGTMATRLASCVRQLTALKPELLPLPDSLTAELASLLRDLRDGRYDKDPHRGDLVIRNYYIRLKAALLNTFMVA